MSYIHIINGYIAILMSFQIIYNSINNNNYGNTFC
jgi:hypothetical protein